MKCLKKTRIYLLILLATLVGCRVQIDVPSDGRVSSNGAGLDCEARQSCTIEIDSTEFLTQFTAESAEGFVFSHWRRRPGGFCGGSTSDCRLATRGFDAFPLLLAILESDQTFYLEPVFAPADSPGAGSIACKNNEVADIGNLLPSLALETEFLEVPEAKKLAITATAADTDGALFDVEWAQTGGPPVVFDANLGPKAIATLPWVDADTPISFQATVFDDSCATTTSSVSITVLDDKDGPRWVFASHKKLAYQGDDNAFGVFVNGRFSVDVNQDGLDDLIYTGPAFGVDNFTGEETQIAVLVNQGDFTYQHDPEALFGPNPPIKTIHTRESRVFDVNGDGRADLLFSDHGRDIEPVDGAPLKLLVSNGDDWADGSSRLNYDEPSFNHTTAVGDIDGDGDTDIVAFGYEGANGIRFVQPLINDGSGHFQYDDDIPGLRCCTEEIEVGSAAWNSSEIADLDGDGCNDIVLGSRDHSIESPDLQPSLITFGNCDGTFTSVADSIRFPLVDGLEISLDLVVEDLNRDGLPDILAVWADENYSADGNRLQVLENQGSRQFLDKTTAYFPGFTPNLIGVDRGTFVDFDLDGDRDLLISTSLQGNETFPIAVLFENETGVFSAIETDWLALNPALMLTDIDGDGDQDIVGRSLNGSDFDLITVLENMTIVAEP